MTLAIGWRPGGFGLGCTAAAHRLLDAGRPTSGWSTAGSPIRASPERLVEQLHRARRVVQLVAVDLRHRVEVAALPIRLRLELRDALEAVDHPLPLPRAAGRAGAACGAARGSAAPGRAPPPGPPRPSGCCSPCRPRCRRCRSSILNRSTAVHDVVEDQPLVVADLLPVLERVVDGDHRLERRPVRGLERRAPSRSC